MSEKALNITVEQWQGIQDIVAHEDNELLRWLEIMPLMEGKSKDYYRSLTTSEFWKQAKPYKERFDKIPDAAMPTKWEHEGRTFLCDVRLNKITGGMFIDSTELGKIKGEPHTHMHKMLAIFWHEKGKDYAEDYEERAEFIRKHMPMYVALPTYEHFFQLWIASLPAIQRSLSQEAAEIGLQKVGDGTLPLTGWRGVSERIGNTLLQWVLSSFLTIWRILPTRASERSK